MCCRSGPAAARLDSSCFRCGRPPSPPSASRMRRLRGIGADSLTTRINLHLDHERHKSESATAQPGWDLALNGAGPFPATIIRSLLSSSFLLFSLVHDLLAQNESIDDPARLRLLCGIFLTIPSVNSTRGIPEFWSLVHWDKQARRHIFDSNRSAQC